MSDAPLTADLQLICEDTDSGNPPIMADIDRTSDPGNPVIRLECGCNEFWLDADQARAVLFYLQRTLPLLERGGEDG